MPIEQLPSVDRIAGLSVGGEHIQRQGSRAHHVEHRVISSTGKGQRVGSGAVRRQGNFWKPVTAAVSVMPALVALPTASVRPALGATAAASVSVNPCEGRLPSNH